MSDPIKEGAAIGGQSAAAQVEQMTENQREQHADMLDGLAQLYRNDAEIDGRPVKPIVAALDAGSAALRIPRQPEAASSTARVSRLQPEELTDARLYRRRTGIEVDNHHNALTCPYCNPTGLVLIDPRHPALQAQPTPSAASGELLDVEKLIQQLERIPYEGNSISRAVGTLRAQATEIQQLREAEDQWIQIAAQNAKDHNAASATLRAQGAERWREKAPDVVRLLRRVQTLPIGALYCRYCPAKSPAWEHVPSCPYTESQRESDEARALAAELDTLLREDRG